MIKLLCNEHDIDLHNFYCRISISNLLANIYYFIFFTGIPFLKINITKLK